MKTPLVSRIIRPKIQPFFRFGGGEGGERGLGSQISKKPHRLREVPGWAEEPHHPTKKKSGIKFCYFKKKKHALSKKTHKHQFLYHHQIYTIEKEMITAIPSHPNREKGKNHHLEKCREQFSGRVSLTQVFALKGIAWNLLQKMPRICLWNWIKTQHIFRFGGI